MQLDFGSESFIPNSIRVSSSNWKPLKTKFWLFLLVLITVTSPVDFISNYAWGGICSLAAKEEFRNLDRDIENQAKRWKKIIESECPEKEKFPQEWKNKTALQRLCMMRALRWVKIGSAEIEFYWVIEGQSLDDLLWASTAINGRLESNISQLLLIWVSELVTFDSHLEFPPATITNMIHASFSSKL